VDLHHLGDLIFAALHLQRWNEVQTEGLKADMLDSKYR